MLSILLCKKLCIIVDTLIHCAKVTASKRKQLTGNKMETLTEYALRIGAKLKPTCLADMPVMKESKNDQPNNFFCGLDRVNAWLQVKDPSGGVNKSGEWPFQVLEDEFGNLSIMGSSY